MLVIRKPVGEGRAARPACTRLLATTALLLAVTNSSAIGLPPHAQASGQPAAAPAREGERVVALLRSFSEAYFARVAGRDDGLPAHVNGHDEFLARWTAEVVKGLHGLSPFVVRQRFPTPGFPGLPADRAGENVIVTVPGTQDPGHAVIVGAHPDGEPTSRGSANDDTSGSVITLELARVLGEFWRNRGGPRLSVEFVLFDAEEQGLIGSTFYEFARNHHALMPRPVLMIDEEQSGIGYPVRPFGLRTEPALPSYAITTGSVPASISARFGHSVPPSPKALQLALARVKAGRVAVFKTLMKIYPRVQYRGGSAPAFSPGERGFLKVGPIPLCCSDNAPFEVSGLPSVTLAGNADYYSHDASPWSFPYDQPEDTFTAMACDSGGSPQPGRSLEAALAVPLELSRVLVTSYAPPAGRLKKSVGPAVFSTIPVSGSAVELTAQGKGLAWNFGDGSKARGSHVFHVYQRAGKYRLTVTSAAGITHLMIQVNRGEPAFRAALVGRPPPRKPWIPSALQSVGECHS